MSIVPRVETSGFKENLTVHRPEVIILPTPEEVDASAARFVQEQIQSKPNSTLTFPTGSTPKGMYQLLVEAYQ